MPKFRGVVKGAIYPLPPDEKPYAETKDEAPTRCRRCLGRLEKGTSHETFCSEICHAADTFDGHGATKCARCGREIFGDAIYCSVECADEAKSEGSCALCGKRIPAGRGAASKYCSEACRRRAGSLKSMLRTRMSRKTRKCAVCGGDIPESRNANARYCSSACSHKALRRRKAPASPYD